MAKIKLSPAELGIMLFLIESKARQKVILSSIVTLQTLIVNQGKPDSDLEQRLHTDLEHLVEIEVQLQRSVFDQLFDFPDPESEA